MIRVDENITLEEFSLSDTGLYYELMNKKEILDYFPHGFENEQKMQEVIEWLMINYTMDKPYRLTYKVVIDGEHMAGVVSYGLLYSDSSKREIAYILSPDYWGKGYAARAVKSFLDYIFREFNEHVMYAEVEIRNENSIRVIEGCGFDRIDTFIDKDTKRGKYLYKINRL